MSGSRGDARERTLAVPSLAPGWRLVVPGWPQWRWGQSERATALLGMHVSALGVGLLTWGSHPCPWLIGMAVAVHAHSNADALAQWAFPPVRPRSTRGAGLAVAAFLHLPVVALLWVLAWPVAVGEDGASGGRGFLVNRWAYRQHRPQAGEWVSVDGPAGPGRAIARIRAEGGQSLRREQGHWWLNGRDLGDSIAGLELVAEGATAAIPRGRHLVEELARADGGPRLVVVESWRIRGRAWAQSWPVWDRQWLEAGGET